MNCPHCQQANIGDARFCAHCGTPLPLAPVPQPFAPTVAAPPSSVPASTSSGSNRAVLIILGVVLLLVLALAGGIYTTVHVAASKLRALAGEDTQTSTQSQGTSSGSTSSDAQQGATQTGNVIGNLLGTDAKGKSDIGNALNNMVKAGGEIERHDKANGNTSGAPDASDTQQAMGAAGGLLSALGSSLGGANRHDPVDFHLLENLLPVALPGMQRAAPRGGSNQAMGIKTTSADVDFHGPANASINIAIKDATAVSGLAGLAAMADNNESEQGGSYEKNESIDGRRVHETWDAQARHGLLSLIVAKRFGVDIEGNNVDMPALKSALAQLDLNKLESMKDVNPQAQ